MPSITTVPAIGTTYRTGQRCPTSGVYAFVRYIDRNGPRPTPESSTIPLAKGHPLPPCMGRGAVWRLVNIA